jgi:hypothetical protein
MFRVENVGTTPAYNVRIRFDEAPRSEMRDIEDLRLLKESIPTMPPGQLFRAYWESSLTMFSEKKPYPHPFSYRVRVAYQDLQGHHYGPEDYILDFRVFQGQATGPKGMRELVSQIEKLVQEHKKWTEGARGIRVNAVAPSGVPTPMAAASSRSTVATTAASRSSPTCGASAGALTGSHTAEQSPRHVG